jgi:hypothetical protein
MTGSQRSFTLINYGQVKALLKFISRLKKGEQRPFESSDYSRCFDDAVVRSSFVGGISVGHQRPYEKPLQYQRASPQQLSLRGEPYSKMRTPRLQVSHGTMSQPDSMSSFVR